MKTSSTTVDSYHLRVMVERMQQEGRSEQEIVAAAEESDDRRPSVPKRPAPRPWRIRLVRARRQ